MIYFDSERFERDFSGFLTEKFRGQILTSNLCQQIKQEIESVITQFEERGIRSSNLNTLKDRANLIT